MSDGAFAGEIAPVTISGRKGDVVVDTDEAPGKGMPDKLPTLRPAFAKDGTITAATSSSISDGAAAVALTCQSVAAAKCAKPVARLVAHAAHDRKGGVEGKSVAVRLELGGRWIGKNKNKT